MIYGVIIKISSCLWVRTKEPQILLGFSNPPAPPFGGFHGGTPSHPFIDWLSILWKPSIHFGVPPWLWKPLYVSYLSMYWEYSSQLCFIETSAFPPWTTAWSAGDREGCQVIRILLQDFLRDDEAGLVVPLAAGGWWQHPRIHMQMTYRC